MHSQLGDVYAYGNILAELSVIRCVPVDQTNPNHPSIGARLSERPLRISTQPGNLDQKVDPKFIKVLNC